MIGVSKSRGRSQGQWWSTMRFKTCGPRETELRVSCMMSVSKHIKELKRSHRLLLPFRSEKVLMALRLLTRRVEFTGSVYIADEVICFVA